VDALQAAAGEPNMAVNSAPGTGGLAAHFDLEGAAGDVNAVQLGVQEVKAGFFRHKSHRVLVLSNTNIIFVAPDYLKRIASSGLYFIVNRCFPHLLERISLKRTTSDNQQIS
jgi:hypothetical protein